MRTATYALLCVVCCALFVICLGLAGSLHWGFAVIAFAFFGGAVASLVAAVN